MVYVSPGRLVYDRILDKAQATLSSGSKVTKLRGNTDILIVNCKKCNLYRVSFINFIDR